MLQQSGDPLGAQQIILSEIEKQYGGAATAAGSAGFAGALDSAGEAWRDFLETLGASNESGAAEFLNGIAEGLAFITRNFDVIDAAGRAVVDVLVAPFKAMLEGIQSTVEPLNSFEADFRATFAIVTKVLTDLTNNVLTPLFKFVGQIFGQIITWLGQLVGAVAGAMDSVVSTVTGALRTMASAMEAFINASPAGLLRLFGIDAGAAVAGGMTAFADGIDRLSESVSGYAAELTSAGQAAAEAANGGGSLPGGKDPFKVLGLAMLLA